MAQDSTQAVEYYKALLLSQYSDAVKAPKARATAALLAQQILCDLVPLDVGAAFDLDTAVGPQLDVIGEYVGFSRRVIQEITRNWFVLVDYATYNPALTYEGMTDYTSSINSDSVIYDYRSATSSYSDLTDDEYRYMLKMKIFLNNCDGAFKTVVDFLWGFFGNDVAVVDGLDMTLAYYFSRTAGRYAQVARDQLLLPRGGGVALNQYFSVQDPARVSRFGSYAGQFPAWTGYGTYAVGFNGWYYLSYGDTLT